MTRYRFFSLVFLWGSVFFLFGGMLKAQEAGSSVTALGFPESAEAVRAFSTGDEARAYALLTPLSASNSAYPPPGVLVALLCSNRGDYEGMHRALGRAVVEQPLDPEPYFQLADVAIQEMRLVEAALLLERGSALLEKFRRRSNDSLGGGRAAALASESFGPTHLPAFGGKGGPCRGGGIDTPDSRTGTEKRRRLSFARLALAPAESAR